MTAGLAGAFCSGVRNLTGNKSQAGFPGFQFTRLALFADGGQLTLCGALHLTRCDTIFQEGVGLAEKEVPTGILDGGREVFVPAVLDLGQDHFAYGLRESNIVPAHTSSLCDDMHKDKRERRSDFSGKGGMTIFFLVVMCSGTNIR
ncbi:hypothetical protein SBV1_120010 [Verrucomicrobia bacterium]|nr:hypothetical protein SBV1_120010 [Verrucomicrobiota bacterium]